MSNKEEKWGELSFPLPMGESQPGAFVQAGINAPTGIPKDLEREKKLSYFEGYEAAVRDFGIWKDGVARIGMFETPIREVIERKRKEMGL